MFRFIARSKSPTLFFSAAVLASTMLASAAIAAPFSAGNSFEIPFAHSHAYYSPGTTATNRVTHSHIRNSVPSVVQRSTTNPNCHGGYSEMDRSEAGDEGAGLVMPCHG